MSFGEDIVQSISVSMSALKSTFNSYSHRADIAENQTQSLILWGAKFNTNWITILQGGLLLKWGYLLGKNGILNFRMGIYGQIANKAGEIKSLSSAKTFARKGSLSTPIWRG